MRNKKGFTLLEIMIVVIIVGVLAALALPRLFSTVEYSRVTEAFSAITSIRSAMERCYLETQDFANCDAADFSELDMPDPGNSPGAHFTYTLAGGGTNKDDFTITAHRTTVDGGHAGDTVVIKQTGGANPSLIKYGTGAFEKVGTAPTP